MVIDLSAWKQLIWEHRNDCDEHVDGSKGDSTRWMDTSTMLSDSMSPDRLVNTLSTGLFDMTLSEENIAVNAKSGQWRALKKKQK